MRMQGTPAGGFRTVGQIVGTNRLFFRTDQNAEEIANVLLESHMSGAPVVDNGGKLVGFISELDILRAYESGRDRDGHLHGLTAMDIMTRNPVTIDESTAISEALRIMKENHWLSLPVEQDGIVKYSVTRHDLLRAYTGIGLGPES